MTASTDQLPPILTQALATPAGRALIRAFHDRQSCEQSFSAFIRAAWPVVEPGNPYQHNWHIDLIAEYLMAVDAGTIRKLIINIPPRHMKPVWEEEPVLLADGRRVPLCDIVPGDRVITATGQPATVGAVHEQGELETLTLSTESGRSITLAPDHPVLTPEGWVPAGRVAVGQSLAIPTAIAAGQHHDHPAEAFRLAGYIVGDGSVTGTNAQITCFDPSMAADIAHCAATLDFGTTSGARGRINLVNGGRDWLRETGLAGYNSHTKRVPEWVLTASPEQAAHFIGAYFACDGTFNRRGGQRRDLSITFNSVNEPLLRDVQHLLARIGVQTRLRKVARSRGTFVPEHVSYRLSVTSKDHTAAFLERVPIIHAKGEELKAWSPLRRSFSAPWQADEVVSVEPAGTRRCRCLTIEEGHPSFLVNDLVVHNSTIVTVMWPVWSWIHRPESRWQFWSYSGDLMTKHSLDRRAIVESEWFQGHWGHDVNLSRDENRKSIFMNSERGVMDATRNKTGKGGNRMVIDDPVNPEDALSEISRRTANRTYDLTLSSRLDNPAEDATVIVMQRLHEDDLSGHLMDQGFTVLSIPSIAEERTTYTFPISGRTVTREQGDLLWPARFPDSVIAEFKVSLGAYGFASQHQQRPVPMGGSIFSAARWGRYRREELPERFGRVIAVADTAHESGQENDFSVIALWAEGRTGWYLLDLFKKQMEYPELEETARRLWKQWRALPPGWRPHRFVIENKSSGIALRQRLAAETRIPVEAFNPGTRDKTARAHSISGYHAAGRLHLPEREGDALSDVDTGGFIAEHALFPNGRHDDQVDTTVIAILWYTDEENNNSGSGIVATGTAKGRW